MRLKNFIHESINGELDLDRQKQFLLDLNKQGFTGSDVASMVELFYEQMPEILDLPGAIDLCGTGGSELSRINTSTLSAIVLAACGVPVAKHGNKAASGRFGSFDLLEALEINIMTGKDHLESLYAKTGLAFIFARSFHPVFKHFAQVRQELKVKTIFNILGPLLNPANPQYQIIGTSNPNDMQLIADAARELGKKHVIVLNGSDGLDELTLSGKTSVLELREGIIEAYTLKPQDFGFYQVGFHEIQGGDREFNVSITNEILSGSCKTEHLNLVLANTALALKFMGKVDSYMEGVEKAREVIMSGAAESLLENYSRQSNVPDILRNITSHKRKELEDLKKTLPPDKIKTGLRSSSRSFKLAISMESPLNLIAEIKMSSPSEKVIYTGTLDVAKIASTYESSGVDAISVLTDSKYFNGSLEYLKIARDATQRTPLLMKDFVIDEYQIYLARYYGADAILLLCSVLSLEQINTFYNIATFLGMDVLLESHTSKELTMALQSRAEIIGINNRDLHSFKITLKTFLKLFHRIPKSKIVVAESGYTSKNVHSIQGLANAVLVGTAIMKSTDIGAEVEAFKSSKRKFKACGIRTVEAAEYCEKEGVAFVGLNFVPSSKRCIDLETARDLCQVLNSSHRVGVFMDQAVEDVNNTAHELGLDFVQLSGHETVEYCQQIDFPIIKTLRVNEADLIETYSGEAEIFIFDGAVPGSGQAYDYSLLQNRDIKRPFLVAGGININNVESVLLSLPKAMGVDAASGIETDSNVDINKIDIISQKVLKV